MIYPRLYFFEPPETSIPEWRNTELRDILERTQAILADLTREEIDYAISTLNYLFGPAFTELLYDNSEKERFHVPSAAQFLRTKMQRIAIDDQKAFPNARWSHYFACLALAYAGRTFVSDDSRPEVGYVPEIDTPPRLYLDPESLRTAAESIAIAESLVDFDSAVETQAKRLISLRKREAAIRGNARRYELWDELKAFWIANKSRFRNNRKSAILHWFDQLDPDDQRKLLKIGRKEETAEERDDRVVRTLRPKLMGL